MVYVLCMHYALHWHGTSRIYWPNFKLFLVWKQTQMELKIVGNPTGRKKNAKKRRLNDVMCVWVRADENKLDDFWTFSELCCIYDSHTKSPFYLNSNYMPTLLPFCSHSISVFDSFFQFIFPAIFQFPAPKNVQPKKNTCE